MLFRKKKKIENALLLIPADLSQRQLRFAFRRLLLLVAGIITPFQFKMDLLLKLGYKPNWKNPVSRHLFIVALENLSLLFRIEKNEIVLNYDFPGNPFPYISSEPPTFTRNITVETNITARQFANCLDLVREINRENASEELRQHCLIKIVEALYKIPFKKAKKISPEIIFAVSMWFTGIALFFHRHPVYSILFKAKANDDGEKINLGMNKTILHLQRDGYMRENDMNLIDFFDAQVKSLKDSLSASIAAGVKLEELVRKTGLDAISIIKLT